MFNGKVKIKAELEDLRLKLDSLAVKLNNEVDKKLIEFHREITERYFETLEKIFRFNKEISLINTLAQQVSEKDMTQLKMQLLQPALEARWSEKKRKDGEAIVNSGVKVIERRKELHDQMLLMEKQNAPKDKLDAIKNQISSLDWIIKEVQK